MKLIESKAEYIPQEEGLEGIYKQIELSGRTCYKSEDKITENSAKGFVDRMVSSKHTAMLEHGTVYLNIFPEDDFGSDCIGFFIHNKYSVCARVMSGNIGYAITTNFRVIVENNLDTAMKYLCSPIEFHEKRYTMRFTCSRAISHELVRSRTMSFAQESQRYINYSKERHGGEIPIIIPSWSSGLIEGNTYDTTIAKMCGISEGIKPLEQRFLMAMCFAEEMYFEFLKDGCTPQQARDVLPNATKTGLIMTGFASDYRHLFDLRLFEKTGAVHPDMKDLMQKAQKAMQEAGIWEDIMSKPSKFE